jgi:hypothetical protein
VDSSVDDPSQASNSTWDSAHASDYEVQFYLMPSSEVQDTIENAGRNSDNPDNSTVMPSIKRRQLIELIVNPSAVYDNGLGFRPLCCR